VTRTDRFFVGGDISFERVGLDMDMGSGSQERDGEQS